MLDAYRDLIDELLGTPTEIRAQVERFGEDGIPPAVRQLIAEIQARDIVVLERARSMTLQQNAYLRALDPPVPAFDQDLHTLLADLEAARGDLVSLLINLSLKDWERTAIHETQGEVSLADEIEQHVEFDELQRARIQELLGA